MIHNIPCLCVVLFLSACATSHGVNQSASDTIPFKKSLQFERAIHFLNDKGDDTVVVPGQYSLQPRTAEEQSLLLVPAGEHHEKTTVIEVFPGKHEEELKHPRIVSFPGGSVSDLHYIAPLLPGGTGYETVGSYSGVWARGGWDGMVSGQLFQGTIQTEFDALEEMAKRITQLNGQGRLEANVAQQYLYALRNQQNILRQHASQLEESLSSGLNTNMQVGSQLHQVLSNAEKVKQTVNQSVTSNLR